MSIYRPKSMGHANQWRSPTTFGATREDIHTWLKFINPSSSLISITIEQSRHIRKAKLHPLQPLFFGKLYDIHETILIHCVLQLKEHFHKGILIFFSYLEEIAQKIMLLMIC